ncbi:MAG: hypothetical protein PHT46_07550 [Candidatus Marinimicrobia bacterium]|jgi:hypothetical protein|nr:hypothetical protein [Candidatus Neomarinimicrobiota bacterium]MDD5710394.1 hypothetical protein [Candidatus Neomarinimicrobiota bacterium]MDX9778201.1 hypothetical protein [bacterium]
MIKKRTQKTALLLLLVLFLLTAACSKSHHNVLVFRVSTEQTALSADTLKTVILQDPGVSMLVTYPDSDLVIVHYDRYKTHQSRIESRFPELGYKVILLEKYPLEAREQPWQKK